MPRNEQQVTNTWKREGVYRPWFSLATNTIKDNTLQLQPQPRRSEETSRNEDDRGRTFWAAFAFLPQGAGSSTEELPNINHFIAGIPNINQCVYCYERKLYQGFQFQRRQKEKGPRFEIAVTKHPTDHDKYIQKKNHHNPALVAQKKKRCSLPFIHQRAQVGNSCELSYCKSKLLLIATVTAILYSVQILACLRRVWLGWVSCSLLPIQNQSQPTKKIFAVGKKLTQNATFMPSFSWVGSAFRLESSAVSY